MSFSFKDKQIFEVPPHRTGNIRTGVERRDPLSGIARISS
jgi:hypothetical protein